MEPSPSPRLMWPSITRGSQGVSSPPGRFRRRENEVGRRGEEAGTAQCVRPRSMYLIGDDHDGAAAFKFARNLGDHGCCIPWRGQTIDNSSDPHIAELLVGVDAVSRQKSHPATRFPVVTFHRRNREWPAGYRIFARRWPRTAISGYWGRHSSHNSSARGPKIGTSSAQTWFGTGARRARRRAATASDAAPVTAARSAAARLAGVERSAAICRKKSLPLTTRK
jgi:hypothetical protein